MNKIFTKKLFLHNSYLDNCEAEVLKVNENHMILNQTVFYPNSGGQPGDTGKIIAGNNEIEIVNTIQENGLIKHIFSKKYEFDKNTNVKCLINWDRRYNFMKIHSCLHLLCSIIKSPVTGGSIGLGRGRLDFDLETKPNKEDLTNKLQKLINNNFEISSSWISDKALDKNPNLVRTMSVAPPRGTGKVRMIKIGDNIDYQPCGGTHVKKTSEIGEIEVSKIENKGKKNKRVILTLK